MTRALVLGLTLTAASVAAAPPQAPQRAGGPLVDARWAQWLGCWRLQDDPLGTGLRLCVVPDDATRGLPGPAGRHDTDAAADPAAGVRWEMIAGAQRGMAEAVLPDGQPHPVRDADCRGTQRAEWSANGRRLYRTVEVTCANETPRKVSTAALLTPGPVLVVVQVAEGGATRSVRVQRYRRAADQMLPDGTRAPQPASAAPPIAGGPWTTDEIVEASRKLPAEGVQAILTETRGPFTLNRKSLLALSNAGVPESVIDLMIGLTYPKRFVVERAGGSVLDDSLANLGWANTAWYDPIFFSSILGASYFYDCYSPFASGYRSYYSQCLPYYGYGPYSAYYRYPTAYRNGYYYTPPGGWVVVSDAGPAGPGVTPAAEGRVVKGRGYTQVRPRDPEPAVPTTARSGGAFSGSGSGVTSGGSSGVSSGGYSSGGGGGSSGGGDGSRVAVPRPPGGD